MCSWRSCCFLLGCPPLSHIVHTSYSTPKSVGWYIHTGIIVLGPLRTYWQAWFKTLISKITVPPESDEWEVGGLVVIHGVVHPSHILSMPHIKLLQQWDSMSTRVSLSLDHCAITDGHTSRYLCLESGYYLESEPCVFEGLAVVYGMVNPSHILSMPHIVLQSPWGSMSIQVSLSLDNWAITDRHGSSYFSLELVYQQRVKCVSLRVLLWSMGLFTPLTHCPCLI